MNKYNITIQPAKVVKETYVTRHTEIVSQQPPSANGEFSEVYSAKIELDLGKETIKYSTDKGFFETESSKYNNQTKIQRINMLGRVVGKLVANEMKAIFSNNTFVKYAGLPETASKAVDFAKAEYNMALNAYQSELQVPKDKTVPSRKELIIISNNGTGIDREGTTLFVSSTIDDKF